MKIKKSVTENDLLNLGYVVSSIFADGTMTYKKTINADKTIYIFSDTKEVKIFNNKTCMYVDVMSYDNDVQDLIKGDLIEWNEIIKNGTYGMKIPNIPMTKLDRLVADLDYCATKVDLSLEDRTEIARVLLMLGYDKTSKTESREKEYLIAYTINSYDRLLTQTIRATIQKEAIYKFRKEHEKEPIIAITLME